MLEAIRLFTVSTMDAARSGINQHMNLTPEMANEIKVCERQFDLYPPYFVFFWLLDNLLLIVFFLYNSKQKPR